MPLELTFKAPDVIALVINGQRWWGADLSDAVRMLALEFRRFSLDHGWYFYPGAFRPEAIEKDKIRNGHIDRRLFFPLEDLYGDRQKGGTDWPGNLFAG